jgi:hypothetical protein
MEDDVILYARHYARGDAVRGVRGRGGVADPGLQSQVSVPRLSRPGQIAAGVRPPFSPAPSRALRHIPSYTSGGSSVAGSRRFVTT